jgi:hypothetical protein
MKTFVIASILTQAIAHPAESAYMGHYSGGRDLLSPVVEFFASLFRKDDSLSDDRSNPGNRKLSDLVENDLLDLGIFIPELKPEEPLLTL